ncbi:acid protease [Daldinia caldariorum]|uniref:acid protease n=1 Tax=Daldinia caldariorum TaxID=326644 RepID=UPI0020085E32|nr:acid protease [Daldinia caldariorum]KAI1470640.1 acid protease [Daldinia caldariorum]
MFTYLFATIIGTLLVPDLVNADDLSALWIEPSLNWYGVDGNWSSIGLFVGEPAQEIDVLVSTSLSEIWVVENGGCGPNGQCVQARGGVYNTTASQSWSSLGAWQLGLDYLGIGGNGDYAMETVVVYDSVRRWQTSFNKQVVAGVNETGYFNGLFGLGITPGRFNNVVAQSPIAALVEQDGTIPSHSYGYTAGAYYAGERGVPLSLTLGGYDANRFEPHNTKFSLNATSRHPEVLVRAITASVSDASRAPTTWPATSIPLSSFNESVTAVLDSSTPYLWLPPTICDRFAASLNLTWNETYGVYVFSNSEETDNLERFRSSPDLSFTFTLSSAENHDNFGQPLDVPGVVNITVSANAFIQTLRYPFMNIINYTAAAVPYFPLKRTEANGPAIIGRSFFQEAYLITNYETSSFSIHKARFPERPLRDTSIQTVATWEHSPYPGPPPRPDQGKGLTEPQTVGLAIGISFLGVAAVIAFFVLRRRRRKQRDAENTEDTFNDKASTIDLSPPTTPVARIVSKMSKRRAHRKGRKGSTRSTATHENIHEEIEENNEPKIYEFAADQSHERYELPGPEPAELDATTVKYVLDAAGRKFYPRNNYDYAKHRLERQGQELAPEYAPRTPESPTGMYHNISPARHYGPLNRTTETPSPASSPAYDTLNNNNMPSPLSSQSGWTNKMTDAYSSMGFVPTQTLSHSASNPNLTYTPSSPSSWSNPRSASVTRSASTAGFSTSHDASIAPPPTSFQRAPIDASRVICLGPLPDNIRLPNQPAQTPEIPQTPQPTQQSIPGIVDSDGQPIAYPPMPPIPDNDDSQYESRRASRRVSRADTLGSNYTIEEEARMAAAREQARIDGPDLIHIPQLALQRYSWEIP